MEIFPITKWSTLTNFSIIASFDCISTLYGYLKPVTFKVVHSMKRYIVHLRRNVSKNTSIFPHSSPSFLNTSALESCHVIDDHKFTLFYVTSNKH